MACPSHPHGFDYNNNNNNNNNLVNSTNFEAPQQAQVSRIDLKLRLSGCR
jgi:hypothetical protein